MANQKIIDQKKQVVDEITNKMKDSVSYIFFEYHGLTVSETNELRRKLKENGSELKIYKNTLSKRALENLNINIDEHLNGPKAIAFGNDAIAPIKTLSEFAKKHENLQIKVGVIDGEVTQIDTLNKLATIPSRDTLLTMLAGGLIGVVKDLSICLDLYSQNLEKES